MKNKKEFQLYYLYLMLEIMKFQNKFNEKIIDSIFPIQEMELPKTEIFYLDLIT